MGLRPLLGNLCILARQGKVWQDVDHDLGEAVCQQLSPVLLQMSANRLHLLKVVQEDQVGDQHLVGGTTRVHKGTRMKSESMIYDGNHVKTCKRPVSLLTCRNLWAYHCLGGRRGKIQECSGRLTVSVRATQPPSNTGEK